jgi:hypothetical protein
MTRQGAEPPSDTHQVPLGGPPAVHQPVHLDQEGLLVPDSPCDIGAILAEPLLQGGVCKLTVDALAFGRKTVELGHQLLLVHLVQARHRP